MNSKELKLLRSSKILVTGGAGFIGSNLCETLLNSGSQVSCLDNFSTGKKGNLADILNHPNFTLFEGDIRELEDCKKAVKGADYILHQAALGSVPRSIEDPITSTNVNITGFVNMLIAGRDAKIKRFVYAASSSTYGDSKELPKTENKIGKPLSPYAITKYVNELYADIFHSTYGMETIGLRYFNVFGRKQDPNGAYAAVIPKFVMKFMKHESPVINGNGSFSRDFTYIDNVIQMNLLAMLTEKSSAVNQVFNVAVGKQTTLLELTELLREILSHYDPEIATVKLEFGPERAGDIPHSLASIQKAKKLLGYSPNYDLKSGLTEAVKWYWKNLKEEAHS